MFESSRVADLLDEEPSRGVPSGHDVVLCQDLLHGGVFAGERSAEEASVQQYGHGRHDLCGPACGPGGAARLLPSGGGHCAVHDGGVSAPGHTKPATEALRAPSDRWRTTNGRGARFYGLAARDLEVPELGGVMATLSENFTLARRALNHFE